MEVVIHPRVKKFINLSGEKERIIAHLKVLANDPYNKRSGMDIKKMKGREHDLYRLRIGEMRFEYFIEDDKVWIDEAFMRGRGYR
jgi:mRNA-degrading endonuclease RelE of RelBE toxin-antitoxin system